MIARRVEPIRKLDRRRFVRCDLDLFLTDPPAVDQKFNRLMGKRLAAETLQTDFQGHVAADDGQRVGRPQAGDGEVVGRRLAEVDDRQGGFLSQLGGLTPKLRRSSVGRRRRPRDALQIGEEIDLVPVETGILASDALDELANRGHRGRQIGDALRKLQPFDFLDDDARLQGGGHHHPRRRRHHDQREGVALRTFLDDPPGHLFRQIESRFVGRLVGHRIRAVENQNVVGVSAGREGEARSLGVGFGDGQHHQHDQQRAEGQQQPLIEQQPPRLPANGGP